MRTRKKNLLPFEQIVLLGCGEVRCVCAERGGGENKSLLPGSLFDDARAEVVSISVFRSLSRRKFGEFSRLLGRRRRRVNCPDAKLQRPGVQEFLF